MGIVPYISVRPRPIQLGGLKPSGFGRLVAAPTVHKKFTRAIVVGFIAAGNLILNICLASLTLRIEVDIIG